ncbi:hypothetical protein ACLKA7_005941 [Drosophila subpalustris]
MEELQALNSCEVFNQIRCEFNSYHNKVKKLNSFNFFSGNESQIKELVRRVNNVLLEHELVNEKMEGEVMKIVPGTNLNQLRGTLMYIILNSVHIKSEEHAIWARWNPQCVHLLNQWPAPLSQLVTVTLALDCGMSGQFLEFLACGSPWLTSQYLDCLNENLSHVITDHFEALPLICGALESVAKSICYHQTNVNLMPNALRLLQRHLLGTEERLSLIRSSLQRHRYLGEAMRHLLDVTLGVVASIDVDLTLPDYFAVYALRLAPPKLKEEQEQAQAEEQQQEQNKQLKQQLVNLTSKLMDTVQRLLPMISVNTYMYWQDFPSGRLILHLQAHIGNQCQQLLQLLSQHEELQKHSLVKQLGNFAEGAQTFEQRLEMLTLGELLSFLDGELGELNEEQLLQGLNQLFKRPIAFGSDECVESMAKHVRLLNVNHAHVILDHLLEVKKLRQLEMEQDQAEKGQQVLAIKQEQMEEQEEEVQMEQDQEHDYYETYDELLVSVLLPIYKNLSNGAEKLQLLEKRQKLHDLRFNLEDSDAERIFFFNNLNYNKENFPMLQFLDLCFVKPLETWLSLAQLAMVHVKFANLYTQIGIKCAPNFRPTLNYTMQHLMQDERLLKQCPTPASQDFLLHLYVLNIQLNVGNNLTDLQLVQNNYLSALAAGMAKFTDTLDYMALGRLLQTLLQLEIIEQRHISSSWRRFKLQRQRVRKMGRGQSKLKLAKKSALLIRKLGWWRSSNWTLTSQLIRSMDALRGNLGSFEASRIQVLDLIVKYHVQNYPRFASSSANESIDELLQTLKHKDLWKDNQLALLLDSEKSLQPKDCASLLARSSSLEAIKLLSDAIRQKVDRAVMNELARAVDLVSGDISSSSASPSAATSYAMNALKAYGFLFKCYMEAFNDVLIKPAKSSDYPCLIEHLLQTPKLLMKDNLFLAVNNLKTLLNTTEEHVGEEKIRQLVNLNLSKKANN